MLVPGISRRLHFYRSHPAFADDSPPAAPRTAGRSGRPGFLGSISFRSRFAGISDVQRGMYVTSVVMTALAAVLLLAPAAYVRLAQGRRPAEQVNRAVHAMAAGGLAAAGLAMAAAVRLAARWAESGLAADLLGAGTAALFAAAWFVLPRLLSSRLFSAGNLPRSGIRDARAAAALKMAGGSSASGSDRCFSPGRKRSAPASRLRLRRPGARASAGARRLLAAPAAATAAMRARSGWRAAARPGAAGPG